MSLSLKQDGVRVIVPDRYPTYSDHVKQAIRHRVEWLRKGYGDDLATVYVDRVLHQDAEYPHIDGSAEIEKK